MNGTALGPIINIVESIGKIVYLLIPILIGVAVIVFFWGLVQYIRKAGESAEEGRKVMIAGLVSLFVMVSLWGIIAFAGASLGITAGNNTGLQPPTVNGLNGGSFNANSHY